MKKEDRDTRYYIDLDLNNKTIIGWNSGQKQDSIIEKMPNFQTRVFITRGQFNKLKLRK